MKHSLNSHDLKRTLASGLFDSAEIVKKLPSFLLEFMEKTEENNFQIDMNIKHLDKLDKSLERMANRFSFTVVLLAVCILVAGVTVAIGFQAWYDNTFIELSIFALGGGLVIAAIMMDGPGVQYHLHA
jgi:ubiquinone biosynthesis protein